MRKSIYVSILLLAGLFLSVRSESKATEKALVFPVEYTTNNEAKSWEDNNTHLFLTLGDEKKTLSKKMYISYEVYVPKSLMATRGMMLTLSPLLSLDDKNWQWDFDVQPIWEDLNITKSGSNYMYFYYDARTKKEVYKKKYVTIKNVGKYMKVSVKKMPLLSYGQTDAGKKKSIKGLVRKLEFGISVVGSKKAKAMLYIDNVKVYSGKKTLARDNFSKDTFRYIEVNRVKQKLLYISSFNKNKNPTYKKVPDDIRYASSKQFIKRTSKKATTCTIKKAVKNKAKKMAKATYKSLPKWHGVNVCTMYEYGYVGDTRWTPFFTKKLINEIAGQGFNFIRVTLDSRIFYSQKMNGGSGEFFNGNDSKVNLNVLKNIDDLITWCVAKKIHVCLDCHNTPGGYMIGGDEEASRKLLFTEGSKEQRYFYNFWKLMAKRYKGISSNAVSFNLYNEPPRFTTDEYYSKMMKKAIRAIHKIDKNRLIFVDMLNLGVNPVKGLVGEKIVQASHIYDPNDIAHANNEIFECIMRGMKNYSTTSYNYDLFHAAILKRMEEIKEFRETTGTTVMVQEFGCTNYSKIGDIVKYYDDILSMLKEYSLSWATWDYESGAFGYVNTLVTDRIPGAHYQKTGENRYVAKEVKNVLRKYMK